MFSSVINPTEGLTLESSLICIITAIALGLLAAVIYRLNNRQASKNMLVSLMVLPVLVQAVIMLVNGSVGAGIAVMGAFNLVRFRSAPGNSRDICYIFYAMGLGLATGMGYIGFSIMLAVAVGIVLTVVGFIPGLSQDRISAKLLRVSIPENLDYCGCFDDIFEEYCSKANLIQAKTSGMGTMYDLKYEIVEKDIKKEKEMIDKLRARNGNLPIMCGIMPSNSEEL
ncbi:MAG: DUF4956 domain-containing protein [Eubacterium sp.]|nr:DUF4956 domain-containing protein [Eubacterium sp.]